MGDVENVERILTIGAEPVLQQCYTTVTLSAIFGQNPFYIFYMPRNSP